jgi:hypothetical protein
MPRLSLRNSLIVYGRIRRLVRTRWDLLSRGRLLVVPDSKCHLLAGFLISPAPATSFTPLPTPLPRQLGGQAYCCGSKSAPHEALFTIIHAGREIAVSR